MVALTLSATFQTWIQTDSVLYSPRRRFTTICMKHLTKGNEQSKNCSSRNGLQRDVGIHSLHLGHNWKSWGRRNRYSEALELNAKALIHFHDKYHSDAFSFRECSHIIHRVTLRCSVITSAGGYFCLAVGALWKIMGEKDASAFESLTVLTLRMNIANSDSRLSFVKFHKCYYIEHFHLLWVGLPLEMDKISV